MSSGSNHPTESWQFSGKPAEQIGELFRAYFNLGGLAPARPSAAVGFEYCSGNGTLGDGQQNFCVAFPISNGLRNVVMASKGGGAAPFLTGIGQGRSEWWPGNWEKVQITLKNHKVTAAPGSYRSVYVGQPIWISGRCEVVQSVQGEKVTTRFQQDSRSDVIFPEYHPFDRVRPAPRLCVPDEAFDICWCKGNTMEGVWKCATALTAIDRWYSIMISISLSSFSSSKF